MVCLLTDRLLSTTDRRTTFFDSGNIDGGLLDESVQILFASRRGDLRPKWLSFHEWYDSFTCWFHCYSGLSTPFSEGLVVATQDYFVSLSYIHTIMEASLYAYNIPCSNDWPIHYTFYMNFRLLKCVSDDHNPPSPSFLIIHSCTEVSHPLKLFLGLTFRTVRVQNTRLICKSDLEEQKMMDEDIEKGI